MTEPVTTTTTPETPKPVTPEAPKTTIEVVPTGLRENVARSTLKQLGLKPEKGQPASEAITAAKEKLSERKKERRELKENLAKAEGKAADLESKVAALKTYADLELQGLDETARKLVKDLAGEDPAEQLKQIAALRVMSKATAPAVVAEIAPKVEKPANTSQVPAPAPGTSTPTLSLKERRSQVTSIANPTQRAAAMLFFTLDNEKEILDGLAA